MAFRPPRPRTPKAPTVAGPTTKTPMPSTGVGTYTAWSPPKPTVPQQLAGLTPEQRSAFQAWTAAQGGQPAAAPQSALHAGLAYAAANQNKIRPPLGLPAAQTIGFANQRQLANEQYRQLIAENAHQRGQTGAAFGRQFRDMATQFGQVRENQADPFVSRGILGSGIQRENLEDLLEARLRSVGDVRQDRAGAYSAIDQARTAIERGRALQLAQIEQQRQQALAAYAGRSIK